MIIGLVGKPSVGKSTFFRAATLAEADIANYPFTTIDKNEAFAYVRIECVDKDFDRQCNPRTGFCLNHIRFVPVLMIDVAGLVPDAHLGKGRGNQFLDDLRQADVLIHVIDVSGSINAHGEQVETGSYDPAKDIKFLEVEIDMWYYGIIKKNWEKFMRQIMQEKGDIARALEKQLSGLKVTEEMIKTTINKLDLDKEKLNEWSDETLRDIAVELRKMTKPIIIACNKIDVAGANENFERIQKEFPDYKMIKCSAESELALREAAKNKIIDYVPGNGDFNILEESKLNDVQKKALGFIKTDILGKYKSTGVQDVVDAAVFDLLKYIAIFPGGVNKLEDQHGNVLPDCHLMPPGSTALDFAYKVHTDFGKNFVRAIDVKTKRTVGKEHLLKHRDVVEIAAGR